MTDLTRPDLAATRATVAPFDPNAQAPTRCGAVLAVVDYALALEKQNHRLREGLRWFGCCQGDCPTLTGGSDSACTCGYLTLCGNPS